MRSVHTDTPPLADLPARLCNPQIVWRASPTRTREEEGALEHPPAQEQEPWNTPAPAGALTLPILELCSRHPPPRRSKVQTANQRCPVPSLPNLPPCNLRPTTTCQPQTTERPTVYRSDRPAVCYLELHPPRHTRTFHLGTAACVFSTFLSCGSVHRLSSTRPAPDQHLASSRPRDRTRHLAPGNLLEHTDHQPRALQETSPRSSSSLRSPPRATLPDPPPHLARPRRPDSISMAHLRLS